MIQIKEICFMYLFISYVICILTMLIVMKKGDFKSPKTYFLIAFAPFSLLIIMIGAKIQLIQEEKARQTEL